MVYGIVTQSEGHVVVVSKPGRGTTFKLYFPLAPADAQTPAVKPDSAIIVRPGSGTILVVEDEAPVRRLVTEVLESGGYTVLSADGGESALSLAASYNAPIQMLLTDVIMRDIGGSIVARRLSALRPDIRVLYMSGFTDDAIVQNGILNASSSFIQKPFTPSQLLSKVGKVLDAPSALDKANASGTWTAVKLSLDEAPRSKGTAGRAGRGEGRSRWGPPYFFSFTPIGA